MIRSAALTPGGIIAALGLTGLLLTGDTVAQEHRLEERVSRDSWFQKPATDERRTRFRQVVQTLSSPAFNGRLPGTEGGRLASQYVADQFAALGLTPNGDSGRYRQAVALTTMRSTANVLYSPVAPNGQATEPARDSKSLSGTEYVAWTNRRQQSQVIGAATDERALFVGYGVRAPEFEWDDYRGLDVRGKIVVMLIGDPPVRSPADPTILDPLRFEGVAMTRHGRWDHKLALAAELGADAAILIHDTRAAGYPFSAVSNTFGAQRIYLTDTDGNSDEPAVSVWASERAFEAMLEGTNLTAADLRQAALRMNGNPIELPVRLTVQMESQWQDFISHNVVGRLNATVPPALKAGRAAPRQPVVVMAHWDHLGPVKEARSAKPAYYPGAADNASGIAQMLDIARQLATTQTLTRPVDFVALTAEESGLLGARHFIVSRLNGPAQQVPIAGINIDIANIFGRARDVEVIGLGLSTLDRALAEVAREQQRQIAADYAPGIGRLFRSDQYEFIRRGIPALWIRGGRESRSFLIRGPLGQIKRYLQSGYHQPGDVIEDWWDIDSALEDGNLIAAFVAGLSNQPGSIEFNPGSPYRLN